MRVSTSRSMEGTLATSVATDPVHVEVAVLKGRLWAPMECYIPHPSRPK